MLPDTVMELANGVRIAWASIVDTPRRVVSRGLLRRLLPAELANVAFTQSCPTCGMSDHGPVRVASSTSRTPPLVSVSYAGALAVAGVAPPGSRAFGIDAETDSERTRTAIAEALGNGAEVPPSLRPDVFAWTRLEAAAKARGDGLRGEWTQPDTHALEFTHLTLPRQRPPVCVTVALAR